MKTTQFKAFLIISSFVLVIISTSCEPVKEYQKQKINVSDMVLANRKIQKTENSFQTYREGASGGNGGKTGGGCGCN